MLWGETLRSESYHPLSFIIGGWARAAAPLQKAISVMRLGELLPPFILISIPRWGCWEILPEIRLDTPWWTKQVMPTQIIDCHDKRAAHTLTDGETDLRVCCCLLFYAVKIVALLLLRFELRNARVRHYEPIKPSTWRELLPPGRTIPVAKVASSWPSFRQVRRVLLPSFEVFDKRKLSIPPG